MDAVLSEQRIGSLTERTAAAGGVLTLAAGASAVWYFDPTKVNFLPVCPLYKLTGYACPGCGMTRGFHALFHGDVVTALDYNALVPIFGLIAAFFFVSLLLYVIRGRGLRVEIFKPQLLWILFTVLLVFGVVRNIPAYPFSILFP